MDKEMLKESIIFNHFQIIAYFFFTLTMINLFIFLKDTSEASSKEWKYFKVSFLVFAIWSVMAFVETILSIFNKIKLIPSYFLDIEYLVSLTATVLLFIGIYKVYKKTKKESL